MIGGVHYSHRVQGRDAARIKVAIIAAMRFSSKLKRGSGISMPQPRFNEDIWPHGSRQPGSLRATLRGSRYTLFFAVFHLSPLPPFCERARQLPGNCLKTPEWLVLLTSLGGRSVKLQRCCQFPLVPQGHPTRTWKRVCHW